MGDGDTFARSDADRLLRASRFSTFAPTPAGAFTHQTTNVESTIVATLGSSLFTSATSMTSGDVVSACTALLNEMNSVLLVLNRAVYVMESNGLTS